jgi:5,10-methylene-tetrahydrofolate dehydrogenase/methenyl tetrahydrofolate cyclohydrolase
MILSGTQTAQKIYNELEGKISKLQSTPTLAAILV